jgi:acyl-CoA thioesterase FadM
MKGFRHVTPIAVRFRDIDAMGHVNNAVFFTYLESARVEYMRNVVLGTTSRNLSETGLILLWPEGGSWHAGNRDSELQLSDRATH